MNLLEAPQSVARILGEESDGLSRTGSYRADAPTTGRHTRALVTAALADWRLPCLIADAVTCTAELVGNAVQHAVKPVRGSVADRRLALTVRYRPSACLAVEVTDDDPRMPTLRLPEGDGLFAISGRGLAIVSTLADRLTWRRAVSGGKVVACQFDVARYAVTSR